MSLQHITSSLTMGRLVLQNIVTGLIFFRHVTQKEIRGPTYHVHHQLDQSEAASASVQARVLLSPGGGFSTTRKRLHPKHTVPSNPLAFHVSKIIIFFYIRLIPSIICEHCICANNPQLKRKKKYMQRIDATSKTKTTHTGTHHPPHTGRCVAEARSFCL